MDITDEYLKMILALPEEFFDGWKWKEGDQFLRYNHECKYVEIQGHVGNYSLYSYTGKICNINETGDYVEGDLRPVPSQEQLQNKILDYQEETTGNRHNEFTLLKKVYEYLNSTQFPFVPQVYTLKELLLFFAMDIIYGEKWDGEHWL